MNLSRRIGSVITLGALWLGSSRTLPAADFPAINTPPTTEQHPGKFIWADLYTDDQASAEKFYCGLFGWTAVKVDRNTSSGVRPYIVLSLGGRPIAGITHRGKQMQDQTHGRWIEFISVSDVPQALATAIARGGKIISKAKARPDRGTQAIFADAEGAILGVLNSTSGDPGEYLPEPGEWTWAELFSRDPAAAGKFYHEVAGYEFMPDKRTPRPDDFILVSGGYSRSSVIPVPDRPKAHPAWLFFVRVANVRETVAQAVSLGGRVVVAPEDSQAQSWRAVIADPDGAHLGLLQLEETAATKEQP